MSTQQAVADKLAHAYVRLMRHPETCLYAGVMQMGKREVVDDVATACTDGINVKYGTAFFADRPVEECSAIVLHETLHKVFKHTTRHRDYWKEDADVANQAADYVVNDVIHNLEDKRLCRLPDGALLDSQFSGWSFSDVYNFLRKEKKEQGKGRGGKPLDTHEPNDGMSEGEIDKLSNEINDEIKQAGMLAGRLGKNLPRSINDACTAKVDWTTQMQEFLSTASTGKDDDFTHRQLDKRMLLMHDIIEPATHNEIVGETLLAIDTSGSIDEKIISQFAEEISLYANSVNPECIRVLWWDTEVHAEQMFEPSQYGSIKSLLKPRGGGGTKVGCVNKYINDNRLKPDVVVVLTDGYVESEYDWDIKSPTLWLVTECRRFEPKSGRVIRVD